VAGEKRRVERPRGRATALLLATSAVALAAGLLLARVHPPRPGPAASAARFVGAAACAECHAAEHAAWRGSHHALAMQEASERTVLADFADARVTYAGVTSTFSRRDGKFWIRTDGPEGTLEDYEVRYTFGVDPLQQYLVELPGGRLQALPLAWDARPKERGGARWFHLYPNERITSDDELHWTGRRQTWNHVCAECHSTGLEKGYDEAARRYRTTWAEIDVACEACHGPGSQHIAWARRGTGARAMESRGLVMTLDGTHPIRWVIDETSGNARPVTHPEAETEIQLCARCHSRRSQLSSDYSYGRPLMDTHEPALLREGLYEADGQNRGEVYEYGSFLESRMYRAGVACSNCHEPHGLKLRAPGNGVCLQCHAGAKYDTRSHHFHADGSAGSLCASCHMPERTYMVVHARRDHSFRVPRPDLTARLGVPNACAACHAEKPASWAAERVRAWYGHDPKGLQDFADTLHAARADAADAEPRLAALVRERAQPAIARATAAAELAGRLGPASLAAVGEALLDPDPLVRDGALEALGGLPLEPRWALASPLLADPVRAVRIRAAGLLAGSAARRLFATDRADLERATEEYIAAQRLDADQPEAQANLGNLWAARGDAGRAERAFRAAIELDRRWVPAYVDLADLLREAGRDPEGEEILRAGLARAPDSAPLHHGLGLLLVRRSNLAAALPELARAATLAPREARFSYVYAVALEQSGRGGEALAVLDAALARTPGDRALNELRAAWRRARGR
jgi:predicted CXXCH cytochrome family protein